MTMITELSASILAAVPTCHDDCREASTIAAALGLPTPQVATHLGNLRRKGLIDSLDNIPGEARTWHRFDSAWFRHIAATPRTTSEDNLTATDCANMADTLEAAETAAPSNRQAQALTWEGPRGPALLRRDIDQNFHTDSRIHLDSLARREADNETFWRAADLLRNAIGQVTGHGRRFRYEQRVRDYESKAREIDAAEETLAAPETAETLARFDSQILGQAAEVLNGQAEYDADRETDAAEAESRCGGVLCKRPGLAALECSLCAEVFVGRPDVREGDSCPMARGPAEVAAALARQAADPDAAEVRRRAEALAEVESARVEAWTEERVAWANSCGNARLCFVVTGRHVSATFRPTAWPVIVTRDDGTSPAMFYADGRPYGCGKHYESPWQAMAHLLRDNGVEVEILEVAPGQGQAVVEFWAAAGVAGLAEMALDGLPPADVAAQGKIAPRGAEVLDNGAEVLEAFPSPESGWPDARVVLCDTRGQGGHRFATWWQGTPGPSGTIWGHYFHDLAEARADAIRRAGRMTAESDAAEAAEALRTAEAHADYAQAAAEMAEAAAEADPTGAELATLERDNATAAALVARVLGRYVSAAHATAQTGAAI